MSGNWSRSSVELPGHGEPPGSNNDIDLRRVFPNDLTVLRVPLLRGRHLTASGRASEPLGARMRVSEATVPTMTQIHPCAATTCPS
jgi:hypothetical protein